jgi:hypothetical protein
MFSDQEHGTQTHLREAITPPARFGRDEKPGTFEVDEEEDEEEVGRAAKNGSRREEGNQEKSRRVYVKSSRRN